MKARSALLDVYGDHLLARGGCAPVSSLVRLSDAVGVAAPAVRTAISRMSREGWLESVRLSAGPGYRLTPVAARRLDDAAARVYRRVGPWDGQWHVLVVRRLASRAARDRVRTSLQHLGFGPLGEETWVGPRAVADVADLIVDEGLLCRQFRSAHLGSDAELVAQAWDLEALAADYVRWLHDAQAIAALAGPRADDERCYAVRSRLVHEWRKFLHSDPGLPQALLPAQWPGIAAAAFFDAQAGRLSPGAGRFVDACLGAS